MAFVHETKITNEGWGKAQLVKCVPHNHQEQHLDNQNQEKARHVAGTATNPSVVSSETARAEIGSTQRLICRQISPQIH